MPFIFEWDGHVHSGMCPHGSGEPTRAFVEQAVKLGFKRISIIEHYPLPPDFPPPPTPNPVDLPRDKVESYLEETLALREEFQDRIEVLVGFEWDYLPGWEDWTREQVGIVGPRVQDGLLSVHFMHGEIIDSKAEVFTEKVLPLVGGTIEAAYAEYYRMLLDLVRCDLGPYKPRRLGHLNIIRRFKKIYEPPGEYRDEIIRIVRQAADRDMQLDFNMSGLRKKLCGEQYIPTWLIEMIARGEIDIECIFGSDAHRSTEVGAGLEEAKALVEKAMAIS